jgi:opacity protein-like surface antigen
MRHARLWVFALLLAAASVADAAPHGFYLGATFGDSDANADGNGAPPLFTDGSDEGYKIIAGYRLLDILAIEGDYTDYGIFDATGISCVAVVGVPCPKDSWAKAYRLSGLLILPLPFLDLYTKVGFAHWETDLRSDDGVTLTSVKSDGNDLSYGAGIQTHLRGIALRLEYERTELEGDANLSLVSLGVTYTFH